MSMHTVLEELALAAAQHAMKTNDAGTMELTDTIRELHYLKIHKNM